MWYDVTLVATVAMHCETIARAESKYAISHLNISLSVVCSLLTISTLYFSASDHVEPCP